MKKLGLWIFAACLIGLAGAETNVTGQADASTAATRQLVQRIFDDVFNGRKIDAIEEIYHEDFVSHTMGYPPSRGVEAQKQMVADLHKMIPDYHEHLHEMVVDGDLAACRWTSTGTPAQTDMAFELPCLSLYRVKDNKISEQWLLFAGDPGKTFNKSLVRRAMAEIPVADWPAQEALHSPDFIYHGPDGTTTMTREELGKEMLKLLAAFPDFSRTIEDMVAEGDKVVVRLNVRGTHRGEFQGIPATGKRVSSQVMVILRIADGKIAEAWEQYDGLSFMQQLGAIPKD